MKKYFTKFIVILLVVLLTLMVTSGAMAGEKKGFDGAWEAIDFDDSYMVMTINSGNSYFMTYDFGASICDPSPPPEISWSFEGTPIIVDDVLTVEGQGLCVDDGPTYTGYLTFTLTYNKQSDTIDLSTDPSYLVTFSRIGKK